jgi:hypothetical protein
VFFLGMMIDSEIRLVQLPDGSQELHAVVKLPAKQDITSVRTFEQQTQRAVNQIGCAIMGYALSVFDSDGEPLRVGCWISESLGMSECRAGEVASPWLKDTHSMSLPLDGWCG